MTANISLGQFLPGNSVVHRLDPRTKIFLMAVYIAIVFVVKSLFVFLIPIVLLFAMFAFARVPASYFFSALRPMKWLLVFMFILNLFATPGKTVWLEWHFIRLTQEAVEQATPALVLTAALFARFRSRQEATFADKILSAMRKGFGGHGEAK